MNHINEDVIKARIVVAGYKEFNKQTVEYVKSHNPLMKLWTFEKKSIDPNSCEFKKQFIKSYRKDKVINTKLPKENKIKKTKEKPVKKPKVPRPTGLIYAERKKPESHLDFDQSTLIAKAYRYHLSKKTNAEIASLMKLDRRKVISMLRQRDRQLGIKTEKNDSYEKVIELVKSGKTVAEISIILSMTDHNVSYHVKRYNESKSTEELEKEYKEILFFIEQKSIENKVDHCFSSWINQRNCNMKSNLTTPLRNRRCTELIQQGRLLADDEGAYRRLGIRYRIPKK